VLGKPAAAEKVCSTLKDWATARPVGKKQIPAASIPRSHLFWCDSIARSSSAVSIQLQRFARRFPFHPGSFAFPQAGEHKVLWPVLIEKNRTPRFVYLKGRNIVIQECGSAARSLEVIPLPFQLDLLSKYIRNHAAIIAMQPNPMMAVAAL